MPLKADLCTICTNVSPEALKHSHTSVPPSPPAGQPADAHLLIETSLAALLFGSVHGFYVLPTKGCQWPQVGNVRSAVCISAQPAPALVPDTLWHLGACTASTACTHPPTYEASKQALLEGLTH